VHAPSAVREDGGMDGLVQWLSEQLDIDTVRAEETAAEYGSVWTAHPRTDSVTSDTGADVVDEPGVPGEFIAEHDPARVLREIDAKRLLIDAYELTRGVWGNASQRVAAAGDEPSPAHIQIRGHAQSQTGALEDAVKYAATVYANRPGYRDEWRP
jgi:hypothetical protein